MTEQIAIVGMGGVFPNCRNLDEFWQLLLAKGTTVGDIPENRVEIDINKLAVASNRACLISDELLAEVSADLQLPEGYDPLLNLTLAAGQQALHDTLSYPHAIDRRRTTIIVGHVLLPTEFSSRLTADFYFPQRWQRKKVLPINRFISDLPAKILAKYFFDDLSQESFCIDAACASTLYSLKLAGDALLERRADTAICGGVLRTDAIYTQVGFSQLKALSARARCAPFDVNADGLVVGEGAGIFVVKRLSDALADNDRIHGILSAVGLATDIGGNILAPDSKGQLQAMADAYRQTPLTFADIDLVECHATGAPLGDQVELNSLQQLAQKNTSRCLLSAVKGNIGHLLAAAGAASLAKVLLAMRHQKIPAIANFTGCSQDLSDSPLQIVEQTYDWSNETKRAAINGFGFGGINAHAIVEQRAGVATPIIPSSSSEIAIIAVATDKSPEKKTNYRLPPTLIAEMLPQQQLMLDLAIRSVAETTAKTGVYIGLGLDCRIGNFYLRWLGLDDEQPALSYGRTLGSLASVVASRIARRFSCAGPSFTVSDGTMSGVQALRIAIEALRRADIDRAIVGAVDFASHPLNVYADGDKGQQDGGFILVLKRLADAQSAGDKIVDTFSDVPSLSSQTEIHYGYAHGLSQIVAKILAKSPSNSSFNYQQCLTFARGKIAEVLGERFAEIDTFAVRVRLPDEPLMLCHRILQCQAKPLSMQGGYIQTAHDIKQDSWYLDHQRIPVAIAVEAGQADLFLCSLLGIDLHNRGQAVYRLLDAQITFYQPLPTVETTIIYDIHIDKFFRHGGNWFFNFRFVATIDGQKFLQMENGCAGFFSATQLAMGRGLFRGKQQLADTSDGLSPYVSMVDESYNSQQLDCLRRGDLVGCFGESFRDLSLTEPCRLADGRLRLIDRIVNLQPKGGDYRLGLVSGELDIEADAWFLTCHFVDDQVMPGTLMYECCLQTLRIFLWRRGLVCQAKDYCCEPIVGIKTTLKCRGQVTATNKKLRCDVHIKQLIAEPTVSCLADAYLYIDDKLSVTFSNVALQYSGLNKDYFAKLWKISNKKPALYSDRQILAFAGGKPSVCFGDRYRVFDDQRRIARLPGPPYKFLNRITAVSPSDGRFANGASCEAQYDIETDGWYFADDGIMPFSILLEVGLQPCGWLAAYIGCALQSSTDLSFRNLDGQGQQLQTVTRNSGTLTTSVKLVKLVKLSATILCNFELEIASLAGIVYRATTGFGFFTAEALAGASGISGRRLASMPSRYPYRQGIVPQQLQMIDSIELLDVEGGRHRLGLVRGSKKVNKDEWFFAAHFYQDPVVPGSLGLESFLQLLRLLVREKFTEDTMILAPESIHGWCYRGQVVPNNTLMTTMAEIKKITGNIVIAEGMLAVDGLVIYQMRDFAVLVGTTP